MKIVGKLRPKGKQGGVKRVSRVNRYFQRFDTIVTDPIDDCVCFGNDLAQRNRDLQRIGP
jgi:hypothetical protein